MPNNFLTILYDQTASNYIAKLTQSKEETRKSSGKKISQIAKDGNQEIT
jgi:hypothetical protein